MSAQPVSRIYRKARNTISNESNKSAAADIRPVPEDWRGKVRHFLTFAYRESVDDIAVHFIVGLAVAALISLIIPDNFFAETVFGSGILSMLLMVAIGIPMYVCSTSSIPIAVALILKGISPGAAYVFLVAGPATKNANAAPGEAPDQAPLRDAVPEMLLQVGGSISFAPEDEGAAAKWLSDDTRHMLAELTPKPDQVTIAINTNQMNVTELLTPEDCGNTSMGRSPYFEAYREMTIPSGPAFVEEHLRRLQAAGIQPHFMLADVGQLELLLEPLKAEQ